MLVDRLDHAGELSDVVKQRLDGLFDPATGGPDQDGWPLGTSVSEEDIALALNDAPHLGSILDVKPWEITQDGETRTWPQTLKATEIVMLADDPIRIAFATAEVTR